MIGALASALGVMLLILAMVIVAICGLVFIGCLVAAVVSALRDPRRPGASVNKGGPPDA